MDPAQCPVMASSDMEVLGFKIWDCGRTPSKDLVAEVQNVARLERYNKGLSTQILAIPDIMGEGSVACSRFLDTGIQVCMFEEY
jgi:hypothetical protein